MDWTYAPGKFSFGDILRHLAAIERYLYAESVQLKPSLYRGHGKHLTDGYEAYVTCFRLRSPVVQEVVGFLKARVQYLTLFLNQVNPI
jgi:hypothetical protein